MNAIKIYFFEVHLKNARGALVEKEQQCAMKRSTVLGHRKESRIADNPSVFVWVLVGCVVAWYCVRWATHLAIPPHKQPPKPHSTKPPPSLHCTQPTNEHTQTHLDYRQSLTPSYPLQLCSIPWHTAAQGLGTTDIA